MATLGKLRLLAGIQLRNYARMQRFRHISSSYPATQKNLKVQNTNNILQNRIFELTKPTVAVRHYAGAAEMTIDDIGGRCTLVLKLFDKVDPDKVNLDAKFKEDLGLDSLDAVEIIMAIEDEFGVEIPDDAAENLKNLKDIVEFLADRLDIAC